jgi:MATE family multidrug resistance protein
MTTSTTIPSIKSAIYTIAKLALPNMASFVVLIAGNFFTTQFLISNGDFAAVDAVGLGGFMFSMFGLAVAIGLSSALDTVVSQAIGKKDNKEASINLAQARFVNLVAVIPCAMILYFTEDLLVLLKQPEEMSKLAGVFIRRQMFGLVPVFWHAALGCYLRAANRTIAPLVSNVVGTVAQVVTAAVLLKATGKGDGGEGYRGEEAVKICAYIAGGANLLRWLVLEIHVTMMLPKEESKIGSIATFMKVFFNHKGRTRLLTGVGKFVKLAIPTAVLLFAEWFSAEVQTLIAGWGDKGHGEYVSANVTLASYSVLVFMIPVGISNTVSYLVGSSLGAGEGAKAKVFAKAAGALTVGIMMVATVTLYCLKNVLVSDKNLKAEVVKTGDKKDIDLIMKQIHGSFLMLCLFAFIDGVQNVIEAVIRGTGVQGKAVWIKMGAMFVIRFGMGIVLFHVAKLHVLGLWLAAVIAMAASSTMYLVMLSRVNFDEKAQEYAMKKKLDDVNVSTPAGSGEVELV